MHADTLHVTASEARIIDGRPPLIAVTFTASIDAPKVSYLLAPMPAFDLADGIAQLAMALNPRAIRSALLERLAPPTPTGLPHDL